MGDTKLDKPVDANPDSKEVQVNVQKDPPKPPRTEIRVTFSGTIEVGPKDAGIPIPFALHYPKRDKPKDEYSSFEHAPLPEDRKSISVRQFVAWMNDTFTVDLDVDSIPKSAADLSVQVEYVFLDTKGNVVFALNLGSTPEGGTFQNEWKPIDDVSLAVKNAKLEFARVTDESKLSPTALERVVKLRPSNEPPVPGGSANPPPSS